MHSFVPKLKKIGPMFYRSDIILLIGYPFVKNNTFYKN